jgi:hypothetical protein
MPKKPKSISCGVCPKKFRTQEALKTHQSVSPNHFPCPYHPVCFRSRFELEEHFSKSKDHGCSWCNQYYEHLPDLAFHYITNHWKCDLCNGFFVNQDELCDHKRDKHADVYCKDCDVYFKKPRELRKVRFIIHHLSRRHL